jgi:hypothetical protein
MIRRRLIITWLIISILGYGAAIAADVHSEASPLEQVAMLDDASDHHDQSQKQLAHDQCGHGSFHLIGLNFTPAKPPVCSAKTQKSAYLTHWNSHFTSPPSRPPKA